MRNEIMTREKVLEMFDNHELDQEYSDFIIANAKGDRFISNGDMLLKAMEENYLLDEFIDNISISISE
jgi:hypothetical protein